MIHKLMITVFLSIFSFNAFAGEDYEKLIEKANSQLSSNKLTTPVSNNLLDSIIKLEEQGYTAIASFYRKKAADKYYGWALSRINKAKSSKELEKADLLARKHRIVGGIQFDKLQNKIKSKKATLKKSISEQATDTANKAVNTVKDTASSVFNWIKKNADNSGEEEILDL